MTPNPSLDWTLQVQALTRGEVHRSTGQHREPSGKGVNVTRALTGNSVRSVAVLPAGGAEGTELQSLLREEQVSCRVVAIAGAVRVNVSLTEPDGVTTKVNAPGPTLSEHETRALLEAAAETAAGATWVVGSGSLPGGVGDDFYARLGEAVRGHGARFALDSSGPGLLAGLQARPDVVKPNADELAQAVGRGLSTLDDVVVAARELRARGAGTVVVSLGSDGAVLVDEVGVLHAAAQVAEPHSTVGAGDALLAGYLAGSAAGADRAQALHEALAWAAGALRLDGSRVPVICGADRAAVVVDSAPDLRRRLRHAGR